MAFNPATATAKYIDSLGTNALEKAASYTAGSHWLLLWGLVISALLTWVIVRWRILEKLSAKLEKRGFFLRTWAVFIVFFVIFALMTLPWSVYEDWWRESSYGRTSQPLSDYLLQSAIGIILNAVIVGLFFVGVYALIRKAGKLWWLWSGGFAAIAAAVGLLLSPVLIEPIFNEYKPVPAGEVRDALVEMAREADISEDRLLMYDGSRQSNNFTANVSGAFGSARIAISDVAMKEASLDEVKAVTGHEIGHYVLDHVWHRVGLLAVLLMVGFFLANRLFPFFARLFGSKGKIGDPTTIPILLFIIGLFFTLAQPIINASIRSGERAADNYSLRTVNLPDALATALVKTAEYRDPRPSALQEMLFYTHPSVEWRVRNAMNWKAEQMKKEGGR